MAMGWAFSYLQARLKSLGIRLNSCLQFHCRSCLPAVSNTMLERGRRNRYWQLWTCITWRHQLHLHHRQHLPEALDSNTGTERNEGIHTLTTFWKPFIVACWNLHWLRHLYVNMHGGWGKGEAIKQASPRHTYFMYWCNSKSCYFWLPVL